MNFDPASQDSTDMFSSEIYSDCYLDSSDFSRDEELYLKRMPALSLVEATIADSIILGSGGPDNGPITDAGLRFVRYIISQTRASSFGFLPNLKDMDCISQLAKSFITHCGSTALALETMYEVMHTQEA